MKPQLLPHQHWGLELRTSLTKAGMVRNVVRNSPTHLASLSVRLVGVTTQGEPAFLLLFQRYNRNVLNKTIHISESHNEAAQQDRAFWSTQTAQARLQHLLELRRMNYGTDRVSSRLLRVLEITQRTPR